MSFEERVDRFCAVHPDAPRDLILVSHLLLKSARLLTTHVNAKLAAFDLNVSQFFALAMLSVDGESPSMPSELSATIDINRTQITRLLDVLEERGLVCRRTARHDRRSLDLVLTPAGKALVQRAVPVVAAAYRAAWAPLGEGSVTDVTRALGSLLHGLEEVSS